MIIRAIYFLLFTYSLYAYPKVSKGFKNVCILIWITVICEYCSHFLHMLDISSAFYGHLYTIAIVPAYYLIYNEFLKSIAGWKWVRLMYLVIFLFCILNSWLIQSFKLMPSLNMNVISLIVIACSLLFYLQMLKEPVTNSLVTQSKFWLNTAIFVYNTSSFFIFTISNYFYVNQFSNDIHIQLNFILCCLFYPALGFSLWLNLKEVRNGRTA